MSQIHAEESVLVRRQALTCLVATCRRHIARSAAATDHAQRAPGAPTPRPPLG